MAHINIPAPKPLSLYDGNVADNWKKFKNAWSNYEIASGYNKKAADVRVALFLSVVGEQAVELFDTFTWAEDEHKKDVNKIVEKFECFCIPRKNILFETYRFTCRKQLEGEPVDTYLTSLRKLADNCDFSDKVRRLRDQLVFGIRNDRVRERLLRESDPKLEDVIEAIRASEVAAYHSQQMSEPHQEEANVVQKNSQFQKKANSKDPRPIGKIKCKYCAQVHERKKELCPAYGKTCNKCQKLNHFSICCLSSPPQPKEEAKTVDLEEEAKCVTFDLFSVQSQGSLIKQTKTFKLPGTRKYVTFQIDTGASCNVLPFSEYVRITDDSACRKLLPTRIHLRAYGGTKYTSEGAINLVLESQGKKVCILTHVVKLDADPLLSLKTCQDLGILKILDSDQASSYQCNQVVYGGLTKEELTAKYSQVFSGLGKLQGFYKIKLDPTVTPVIHAPRKCPVSIREELQQHLDKLEGSGIIAKVTSPTEWVSSLMIVREPGKFRICLDPRDLNKAIRREHYQLPCIEDITTRLSKAKVFSVMDARKGFWQIELEEESSYLTTFHTPFGRYRWRRMPFGISSAPEIWQRKMHEFTEGLTGVEVIADDFLIVGCGEDLDGAILDHDRNIEKFMSKAAKENLKLNPDKVKYKLQEVTFIGHLLTTSGLKADPKKVEAIQNMKQPENEKDVRRFLGMVQYLAKFLPSLSSLTEPLRRLTDLKIEWRWTSVEKKCFEVLKSMMAKTPVLAYYNSAKPVTIQADASDFGLGAVLLQEGQPVHFSSRALTKTEQRYAQIEKEMLAIVHACSKFDHYIYGRSDVQVETDHKPLEVIFKKSITSSPKRLQRMLLFLQKYQLLVKYKKGSELYIADTLSRANLPASDIENLWDVMATSELKVCNTLQNLNIVNIPNSEKRLQEIREATRADTDLQLVLSYIRNGWPEEKSAVKCGAKPYFQYRDELVEELGLILKRQRIVIPVGLRLGTLQCIHKGHTGIENTLRRAREYIFWPCMNADVKEFIQRCDVCSSYRPSQQREPLRSYEVPSRAWECVSADFFELRGSSFLLIVDNYSGIFEVEKMNSTTAQETIKQFKKIFARYGVAEKLVTDNGPQFQNFEFQQFVQKWGITHSTSSPYYPRSNGKAEAAVKVCKQLMQKALAGHEDFFEGLLNLRNTPDEHTHLSPAQKCFGRRTRTLIPTQNELLLPQQLPSLTPLILSVRKKQSNWYNKGTRELPEFSEGDSVLMRLPKQKTWSPGVLTKCLPHRSYELLVNGTVYRRNRKDIRYFLKPLDENKGEVLAKGPDESLRRKSTRQKKQPDFYRAP